MVKTPISAIKSSEFKFSNGKVRAFCKLECKRDSLLHLPCIIGYQNVWACSVTSNLLLEQPFVMSFILIMDTDF